MFQVAHRGVIPPRPQVHSYPTGSPPSPSDPPVPHCPFCDRPLHGRVLLSLDTWGPVPAAYVCQCGQVLAIRVQLLEVTHVVPGRSRTTTVSPHHPVNVALRSTPTPCACGAKPYGLTNTVCLEHAAEQTNLPHVG